MSKALVAAVALLLAATGIATASVVGNHYPLALFSYSVQGGSTNYNNNNNGAIAAAGNVTVIKPAVINLGNLTAGQIGNYTTTAVIAVNSPGWFVIGLNDSLLDPVFSYFMAKLTIGNQTVILVQNGDGNSHGEAKVYLAKGVYNVTVYIHYVVSPHPASKTVNSGSLLIIGPNDYEEHSHHDHHGED